MRGKNAIAATWVLSFFSVITILFTITVMKENTELNQRIQERQKTISEITTGLEDLESALQTSLIMRNPETSAIVCTEICKNAQKTEVALKRLPLPEAELDETISFLDTVDDFASGLKQKAVRGEVFTSEEMDELKSLSEASAVLCDEFLLVVEDENAIQAI